MNKTTLLFICVIVVAFLFGAWKAYDGIYFKKDKQPKVIKCYYMTYACGDCYPQWHIDSTFAVENGLQELIGQDFDVNHKGKQIEELISENVRKCIICYDFYFTGSLKKTLSNKYKFEADRFQMDLRSEGCCN